jgi:hypothetical protein
MFVCKEILAIESSMMITVRTGKTTEKTTVVDTNSLTSLGLFTQKKTIPGRRKKVLAI